MTFSYKFWKKARVYYTLSISRGGRRMWGWTGSGGEELRLGDGRRQGQRASLMVLRGELPSSS